MILFQTQEAILINCSRGPVVDEVALVDHLRENPMFRVGLDVFEVMVTFVCLTIRMISNPSLDNHKELNFFRMSPS